MGSVAIYIAAFVFTAVFTGLAAHYYNLRKGIRQGEAVIGSSNEMRSDVSVNDVPKLAEKERRAALAKYVLFFALALFPLFFLAAVRLRRRYGLFLHICAEFLQNTSWRTRLYGIRILSVQQIHSAFHGRCAMAVRHNGFSVCVLLSAYRGVP